MFYRWRFDANLSAILKACGYNNREMLEFWPVDATPHWVKQGKAYGWKPMEAACIGVASYCVDMAKAGMMDRDDAKYIINAAHEHAMKFGAHIQDAGMDNYDER